MDPDADIAELFAPIEPAAAFGVVLNEAQDVLAHIREPVDAELWGSDMIEALALLRIFGAIGSPELRAAATAAAERVIAGGVPDPDWAAAIGSPAVGRCWHYSDVGGRQESLTMTFAYGDREHAVSVLIDHGKGGQIKDAWVGDAAGLLDKTWLAAETDPLIVFDTVDTADARDRLDRAIGAGECPEKPDQADDLKAHRALLHA